MLVEVQNAFTRFFVVAKLFLAFLQKFILLDRLSRQRTNILFFPKACAAIQTFRWYLWRDKEQLV